MKARKIIAMAAASIMIVAAVAACSDKKEDEKKDDAAKTEASAEESEKDHDAAHVDGVVYKGVEVVMNAPFADIKDQLGDTVKPDDVILPCDGGDLYKDTIHHYEELDVTENVNGDITDIEVPVDVVPGDDLLILGDIKIGDSIEDVLKAHPEFEDDEYCISYRSEGQYYCTIMKDYEAGTTVSGFFFISEAYNPYADLDVE
ncbi:MAG: hypothetical protein IKN14_08405 [Clostridiales bacterium]|nr:hypothetical protein [Clostridiales bacterium]